VVAVIGNLNSGVSIPAAPVYAAKNIAQLAISTNPKFTELGLATTFRLVANDNLQARAIGSFAANQLNANKFAVVDDGTTYGKGLATGAAAELKKANKQVVVTYSSDDKTTKFDELADKIKDGGVEVVVSTQGDFQILALIEASRRSTTTSRSASWAATPSRRPTCSRAATRSRACTPPRPSWTPRSSSTARPS
jgi:branched-chain amino acid transport system substrate-binding protein